TIMCMFIFILQFGKGDALDRLASWFGGGRYRATTVATINGKKVTDADLDTVRRHRELAETIVTVMTARAHGTLLKDLHDSKSNILADFDDAQKGTIQFIVRQMDERRTSDQFSQFPDLLGGRFLSPEMRKDQAFHDHDRLQNLEQSLRGKGEESKA